MHSETLFAIDEKLKSSRQRPIIVAQSNIIASGLLCGPRIVILHRYNGDFGFTLRHFIVYPPDSLTEAGSNPLSAAGVLNFAQPMDTVFVKKVHPNTPAHMAGLQEGDRLLAVNGVPVTSIPYSQVVATIQQTPKTLTLQVVPKNYDILQTFFSETAHNPETNQRPQPQQPVYVPKPRPPPAVASGSGGAYPKSKPAVAPLSAPPPPPQSQPLLPSSHHHLSVEGVQEQQESLYSTLQEIVADNVVTGPLTSGRAVDHAEVPKILNQQPHRAKPLPYEYDAHKHQQQQQQQQYMQQQHQQFLHKMALHGGKDVELGGEGGYAAPLADGDSALMSRLRKSLEQKEEFLRRPPSTLPSAHDVQQREFYGRPNRLQKSVWPPTQPLPAGFATVSDKAPPTPSTSSNASPTLGPAVPSASGTKPTVGGAANVLREHASQLSAIREHFFTGGMQMPPKSAPPSLAIAPAAITVPAGPSSPTGAATVPLSPHSMHAVSEKAKLFESGRPLSPEGVDRMDLYKSELSRINTKQVVPNVAVRRKEFELKAESTGWRKSIDDKPRSVSSDSESRRTPVRLRSLSVESNTTRDSRHSLASSSLITNDSVFDTLEKDKENQQQQQQQQQQNAQPPLAMLRQKPIRDDSYRNAVRNTTALWVQGPPIPTASQQNSAGSTTSSVVSLASDGECQTRPIPPARTYAAAHRLHHPLSAADTEQMRLKLLHRNQTMVGLRHFLGDGADTGCEGEGVDVEMLHRPPLTSPPLAPPSPLTVASSVSSTSSVPLTHLVAHGHPTAGESPTPAASFRTGTGPPTHATLPTVVMRQKQPHHPLLLEDDERKMRRISYLRATAHENLFQMLESDPDSSPMSLPPADTPDTDPATEPPTIESPSLPTAAEDTAPSGKMQPQQLKSAYRPWRRPRLTTDIQPLRRLFDPESADSSAPSQLPPILEVDTASSSASEPNSKKRSRPRPASRRSQDKLTTAPHDLPPDGYDQDEDDEETEQEDEDGAKGFVRPRPSTPLSPLGKGRSASLVTTTLLGAASGRLLGAAAGSLGNLHVITTTTAGGVVTRNYFFAQSHGTKSKALAHFRDGAADSSEPLVREGELHVKVTLIDGKRSADRSWRTVHAELRGHHLKLTLVREGKNANQ
uniref:PDZ domain-containing protein n=1 Tax=Anopheles epiroticus TaxID=199890 RepID=A0A182PNS0_9DIPT